jgi:ATP-dependent Lon protease
VIEIARGGMHSIVQRYHVKLVRNLEREVNKICRAVRSSVENHGARVKAMIVFIVVNDDNIDDYLGVHQFRLWSR